MSNETLQIVLAVIGSGSIGAVVSGAVTLISKAIDRRSGIGKDIEQLKKNTAKNELDNVRLQLLVLMSDYPRERQEIMRVAEHYFKDLKGNWYMTSMFNRWLEDNGIAKPEWFKSE